eukprot:gene12057-25268_t
MKKWIIFLSFLWLFICIIGEKSSERAQNYKTWMTIKDKELQRWYDPMDYCILKSRNFTGCHDLHYKTSPYFFRDECFATWKCQYTPRILYTRPMGFSIKNRMTNRNNILNFLIHLNQTNRHLVLFGDSITRQSMEALLCILLKLDRRITSKPISPGFDYDYAHFNIYIPNRNQTLAQPHIHHLHHIISSVHHIKINRQINIQDLHQFVYTKVEEIVHNTSGVVMISNWGLHEPTPKNYNKLLNNLFSWAQSDKFGDLPTKNNSFFYRETSTQHFPSSPYGLYGNKHQNSCLPINPKLNNHMNGDPKRGIPWRSVIEDNQLILANNRFLNYSTNTQLHKLRFRYISDKFHDYHPSSPSHEGRSKFKPNYVDCTHFCGVSPILWHYHWWDLSKHPIFNY